MARAPMLPFGKAPPFTDGDPFSMSRTLRWMVENLRTPQEGTIKENLGGGKYRVETFVAPESYIYCKGCGLTVGQKVILFRPIGGTDIDVETEWLALPTCVNGDDGDSGSGSGDSGDCGSGSGDSGSGSGASGSGCGGSGSGDSGSGEPSGSGSGGSGDGDGDGSGGDGDGDGDGDSGSCGSGGSGSGDGDSGGVIRDNATEGCCPGPTGIRKDLPITITSADAAWVSDLVGVLTFHRNVDGPGSWSGPVDAEDGGLFCGLEDYEFKCDTFTGNFILVSPNIEGGVAFATDFECNGGDDSATFTGATFEFNLICGENVFAVTAVVG